MLAEFYITETISKVKLVNDNVIIYKFQYSDLAKMPNDLVNSRFIVYVLVADSIKGKTVLYIGKSTNGLKTRPQAHEDKYKWEYCYVLTQSDGASFLSDGAIQFIEDQLRRSALEVNRYFVTTKLTSACTASDFEIEACRKFLSVAYYVLFALGLNLLENADDPPLVGCTEDDCVIPNGKYYLNMRLANWENRRVKAQMEVKDGLYILCKGSTVCPVEGPGLHSLVKRKRNSSQIVENILTDDVILPSPFACGSFAIGKVCKAWKDWRVENRRGAPSIDIFRNKDLNDKGRSGT